MGAVVVTTPQVWVRVIGCHGCKQILYHVSLGPSSEEGTAAGVLGPCFFTLVLVPFDLIESRRLASAFCGLQANDQYWVGSKKRRNFSTVYMQGAQRV